MNKTQFSHAPWKWTGTNKHPHSNQYLIGNGRTVLFIAEHSNTPSDSNASLIAAAPDLYAALEAFVKDFNEPQFADLNKQIEREASLFMTGQQALRKARGEAP